LAQASESNDYVSQENLQALTPPVCN